MATSYTSITAEQAALIREAPLFFVASAAPDLAQGPAGRARSTSRPREARLCHIIDCNRVAYLDYEGSGNQTARHTRAGGPITIMVMSMDSTDAAVVRLFGHARVVPVEESDLAPLLLTAPAKDLELPQRQTIDITVESTQTSCGYGVPVFEYVAQRVRKQRGRAYKAR
jgi:hypothetical protein